ncbi:MAG: hypothetical protein KTR35_02085 [Gammaproteobacteria bacterium]|nr:hypothetical protein [Gammaproteobacteria bacterium]
MVWHSTHNRVLTWLVSAFLVLSQFTATIAQAQSSPDVQAPVIDLELLEESVADQTQVFSALVADDRELQDVLLYYRRAGQQPFTPATMQPLGDTGYYSVSLETDPEDLRAIEYYVQARDSSGNRTVSGYAFDPFKRTLSKTTQELSSASGISSAETAPIEDDGGISIWGIALGVLLVGALAAAAGGGDGGSNGVPLTVNIGDPL